jgi:hypothetical protein
MCTVSMIGDYYDDKWKQPDYSKYFQNIHNVSRQEFEALKKEVEEMKKLLLKAKEYDEKSGQPHCEMESKVAKLKEIAELMGVNLEEVFK